MEDDQPLPTLSNDRQVALLNELKEYIDFVKTTGVDPIFIQMQIHKGEVSEIKTKGGRLIRDGITDGLPKEIIMQIWNEYINEHPKVRKMYIHCKITSKEYKINVCSSGLTVSSVASCRIYNEIVIKK